jgi:transcriptional regulator with XRE-family HTH domain
MDVQARLAKNLRKHREALGLSQEKFADLIGVHRTYVSDLERGTRNPTVAVVDKMAAALDVTIGTLLD